MSITPDRRPMADDDLIEALIGLDGCLTGIVAEVEGLLPDATAESSEDAQFVELLLGLVALSRQLSGWLARCPATPPSSVPPSPPPTGSLLR